MTMKNLKRTLAAAAVGGVVAVAAAVPAQAVYFPTIFPKYDTRGPGLKNWHCVDVSKSPDWWGPWRYTKAGAQTDCYDYIARGQD